MPSKSLIRFRESIDKMIYAAECIENSDYVVNLLLKKVDHDKLKEVGLYNVVNKLVKRYPDLYIQNLLLGNLIAIMECYLKDRLQESFSENKEVLDCFLKGYEHNIKITVDDVVNGPLQLANKFTNEVIFHNLRKVDNVYKAAYNIDIKKMADFKALNLLIRIRHAIIHDNGYIKGKRVEINNTILRDNLNEVCTWIENIDFFILNQRLKTRHVDYYRKRSREFENIIPIEDSDFVRHLFERIGWFES